MLYDFPHTRYLESSEISETESRMVTDRRWWTERGDLCDSRSLSVRVMGRALGLAGPQRECTEHNRAVHLKPLRRYSLHYVHFIMT